MEFLQYILLGIATFLGLFVGLILARVAREELKEGSKYFELIKRVVFWASIILVFYYLGFYYYILPIIILIIFVFAIIYFRKKNLNYFYYAVLAVVFYFSTLKATLAELNSALIFFFGFPTSGLIYYKAEKKGLMHLFKHVLARFFFYIILIVICFFVFHALKKNIFVVF